MAIGELAKLASAVYISGVQEILTGDRSCPSVISIAALWVVMMGSARALGKKRPPQKLIQSKSRVWSQGIQSPD